MTDAALCSFIRAKISKQPKLSINGWMDKEDMVHAHTMEEWYHAFCNMNGPWGYYAKWSTSDFTHHMEPKACGI